MNGTTYNSAAEYHCIPQYERIGLYLRKCMDNGEWSGEVPKCESNAANTIYKLFLNDCTFRNF